MTDSTMPRPVFMAHLHAASFSEEFLEWLPSNVHVWEAFEREALAIAARGWKHYSAYTIVHVLRHHSALRERDGEGWKLNNNASPGLSRLFALMHPEHRDLFEIREGKASHGVTA